MDKDEESIGGIKRPMKPTRQLLMVTYVMDIVAILLSFLVSIWFAIGITVYIIFSRLYSNRKIRLKKYPILGFLIVILNQGSLTFFMVYHGAHANLQMSMPWQGLVAAAFLIAGFYPITQVYQHMADKKDGVTSISMLLGKRGTFIFCAIMYAIALSVLFSYYYQHEALWQFYVLQLFFVPVVIYFMVWFVKVWSDPALANFKYTMLMNWLASTCTSAAFVTILILNH